MLQEQIGHVEFKEYCMFQYFFVNSVLYIINFMSMHIYTHFVFLESCLLNFFASTRLHKLLSVVIFLQMVVHILGM